MTKNISTNKLAELAEEFLAQLGGNTPEEIEKKRTTLKGFLWYVYNYKEEKK